MPPAFSTEFVQAEKRAGQLEDMEDDELEAGQVEECEAKWAEAEAERAKAARALGRLHTMMLDVEEAFEKVSLAERINGARIMLNSAGCQRFPHLNGIVGVLDTPDDSRGMCAVWFPGVSNGGLVEDVRPDEMLHATSRFQRSALACIEAARVANYDVAESRQQPGGHMKVEEAALRAKKAVDVSDSEQAAMVAPLSHSIPWYSPLIKVKFDCRHYHQHHCQHRNQHQYHHQHKHRHQHRQQHLDPSKMLVSLHHPDPLPDSLRREL